MTMSLNIVVDEQKDHPLDIVERLAILHHWSFQREEDEISITMQGKWSGYHIAFTWLRDLEALHIGCAFDLNVPDLRLREMTALLALINEQLWIGHFDLWPKDKVVMFRQALLLNGGIATTDRQCEAVLEHAFSTCERYYQAFQFVIWAGNSARQALDFVMFETQGHA